MLGDPPPVPLICVWLCSFYIGLCALINLNPLTIRRGVPGPERAAGIKPFESPIVRWGTFLVAALIAVIGAVVMFDVRE